MSHTPATRTARLGLALRFALSALLVALGTSCERDAPREPAPEEESAEVLWAPGDTLTDAELEAGRLDDSWREAVKLGPPPPAREFPLDTIAIPEEWRTVRLPEDTGGEVFRVQMLLDRAGFYPGVLDGRWGKNTEKAVWWFQASHGLEPWGRSTR